VKGLLNNTLTQIKQQLLINCIIFKSKQEDKPDKIKNKKKYIYIENDGDYHSPPFDEEELNTTIYY